MSARVRCPDCGWARWFTRPGQARRAARSHACHAGTSPAAHPSDWDRERGDRHPAEQPGPVPGRRGAPDRAADAYRAGFTPAGGGGPR